MGTVRITEDALKTAASNETTKKAIVKARVIGREEDLNGPGKTKLAPEDPFSTLVSSGQAIEPPFNMLSLSMMGEQNTELGPVIEAMEVNIEGFGYRFQSRLQKTTEEETPPEITKKVEEERVKLENFFMYATDESFTEFRRKLRNDLEYTGCAYAEVLRSASGELQGFVHVPSHQIRLGVMDKELTEYELDVLEMQANMKVEAKKITAYKRFRPMVQVAYNRRSNLSIVGGAGKVWFKELGDPRDIDCRTGQPFAEGEEAEEKYKANEMIYRRLYSPRTPYGIPRYAGNLLSIMGDRASEEINFSTFRNNNIPSMVIAVSNGQLTEGSIGRIKSFVESDIQGDSNYSKFLILEAEGDEEGEDGNQVKLDIKPLTKDQHDDALFQNYSKQNQGKVRRSFRMPPIFVGLPDAAGEGATDQSRKLTDEQVFAPERNVFDEFINRKIFPIMGVVYHKFVSNSPNTTDNTELVRMMGAAEKTGAQTPTIARVVLEEILGRELPPFPDSFPKDVPFSMTMAEAVKNQADATEPGQQVTALKSKNPDPDTMIEYLLDIRKNMEKQWISHLEEDGDCCNTAHD